MSAPIGNNAETVKKGSKVLSKGSHKMFFNETEDQLEQSKIMMPQQNFDNTGMKEKNQLMSQLVNQSQTESRSLHQEVNLDQNQSMDQFSEQESFSDESSQLESQQPDILEADYQYLRLTTIIQNSYEQFVNKECILQPNILEDVGRLRFILIHYVEQTIRKSVDNDGQFDQCLFLGLMNNFQTLQHFLYLQYPSLSMDYDEEQQVAFYELMTDQQFKDQFYLLLENDQINRIIQQVKMQQLLFEDYNQILSKNYYTRRARQNTQGPLDSLVSSKEGLFQQIGKFASNTHKTHKNQQHFKVSIRKQHSQPKTQNKKQSQPQQSKINKNQFQLFNIQPLSNNQPSMNLQKSVSQQIINKNLTYQQFVAMMQRQKKQQQQKQQQKQLKQKQKQKQKRQSQQNKKSHFDQILGRKNEQQSKNYLKPFIGEFKKKQSDNQLRELLGLKNDNTPKKEEKQMLQKSTPEFKQNKFDQTQRNSSQQINNNVTNINQPNLINIQGVGQNQKLTKNVSMMQDTKQSTKTLNPNFASTDSSQNQFHSNVSPNQFNTAQNMQSKSPPSVINPNPHTVNSSKTFQNTQISQKQFLVPRPPVIGNMVSNPTVQNIMNTTPPILSNPQQSIPFNNNTIRQNNLMPQTTNNTFQNNNLNRFQNLNSKNQFQMPKSNQSNPNPQMFSNLQMNQNTNNKSNTNPYLRGQNLPNNPPSINPTVAGHQPQLSSGSQKLQNNSRQPPSFSLSNKINNNPLNPAQNNFNQSLAPHSHFIQNLPTPSQNGFLGPQNVINPVLINLPTTQNQSINPINIQTLSNPTEKMSPQQQQKISKTDSKKLNNETNNQGSKIPSTSLESKQFFQKVNIYDHSVLQNMKLKDFVNVFCQQELRKSYSDLYSELLLMKKWKIVNFGEDSSLHQKLRYLSNFKLNTALNSSQQQFSTLKRSKKQEKTSRQNLQQQEPFPLMLILHRKIEQIKQKNFFDTYERQKDFNSTQSSKTLKSSNLQVAQREFSKIQQVQQLLQQKISLLETEIDLSTQKDKQQFLNQGYLSIDGQLSEISLTLQNVEKWIVQNAYCQQANDQKLQVFEHQHPIKQNKPLNFDLLCQLYHNISTIDSDLEIMKQKMEQFKN